MDRTVGIDIADWEYPEASSLHRQESVRYLLWDFAGQVCRVGVWKVGCGGWSRGVEGGSVEGGGVEGGGVEGGGVEGGVWRVE